MKAVQRERKLLRAEKEEPTLMIIIIHSKIRGARQGCDSVIKGRVKNRLVDLAATRSMSRDKLTASRAGWNTEVP